jgi:hypothetical protein
VNKFKSVEVLSRELTPTWYGRNGDNTRTCRFRKHFGGPECGRPANYVVEMVSEHNGRGKTFLCEAHFQHSEIAERVADLKSLQENTYE